jgi:DNA polymerase (family 10)
MEALLEAASKKGIAVEINGCPERMDLKPEHIRMARAKGVKLVVSSDAHTREDLAHNLHFAVHTARKGAARKGDVLNTLSASSFLSSLRQSSTPPK